MLEKNHLEQVDSLVDCHDLIKSQDINSGLAETRLSLIHRLTELEDEIERRILDTVKTVNLRVSQTTDLVVDKIIKPFDQLEKRMDYLPQKVRNSPYQSLAASTTFGFLLGAGLAVRARQPKSNLANSPEIGQFKPQKTAGSTASPMKEIATNIILNLAQQFIKTVLDDLAQRHAQSKARAITNL